MLTTIRSDERGHLDHGWLNARHTFSFGDYHNPERMGFESLRVINDDIVAPARGFSEHPHRDMAGTYTHLNPPTKYTAQNTALDGS